MHGCSAQCFPVLGWTGLLPLTACAWTGPQAPQEKHQLGKPGGQGPRPPPGRLTGAHWQTNKHNILKAKLSSSEGATPREPAAILEDKAACWPISASRRVTPILTRRDAGLRSLPQRHPSLCVCRSPGFSS